MKYTYITTRRSWIIKRGVVIIVTCTLFLITPQHEALGQWTQANGIVATHISGLTASGDTLIACGGISKPDSIFVSTTNGSSWSIASSNVPTVVSSIVNVGTDFVVGSAFPGGSYFSTDFGSTWNLNILDLPNSPHSGDGIFSLIVFNNIIFAAEVAGVCQQPSPGAAWVLDTVGTTFGSGEVPTIISLFASGSNFFSATQGAGAYLSTNNGASWSQINNGLPSSYLYGTTVDYFSAIGSTIFATVADTDQIHTDIYSTINNGLSWNKLNLQPQNVGDVYGFISSGSHLFVAGDSGIYESSDNGVDWSQTNLGLPGSNGNERYIISLDTSGPNLVVGTFSNGVWTRKLSDFPVSLVSPTTNAALNSGLSLSLSENPASNVGTKIEFTVVAGGIAQVMIMDELGRTVRMLQHCLVSAGQNEVTLDPLTLESGTYFVRVTSNGMSEMQKLVIAR